MRILDDGGITVRDEGGDRRVPVLHAAKAVNALGDVDLETVVLAAGLDPDHLPDYLSVKQERRLVSLLEEHAGAADHAG